ncbi:MAG TPA: helix-turn-helix transcriptional regulator [Streptosporangiaceae bacterium]|nr:helix-turn-helix transcriptional regulator [Streptosporangiaceae bacterium]
MREQDPSVCRRRLRKRLRQLREENGLTQTVVAQAMDWSKSKLIRIEAGQHGITANDLRALLDYYHLTDSAVITELVEMARNSRKHSWLSQYKDVASDVFLTFAGYEESAVRSYSFQPVLVPGLLQTDEYAAAVLAVVRGSQEPSRINKLIELRVARQERVFARQGELKLHYILDESVVRRAVGGAKTMRRQLAHLIELRDRADVSLRILPFSAGVYRSMRVPFVVLESSEPEDEAILYLEYPQGESLIREDGPPEEGGIPTDESAPTAPPTYLQIFSELQELTSDEETADILQSALSALNS